MLTQEIVKEFLDYDPETGKLFWKERDIKWFKTGRAFNVWNSRCAGKEAFASVSKIGYFQGAIFHRTYVAQQVIWLYQTGKWPNNEIDHINRDKKDNRFVNLRDVSHRENSHNQSILKNNTSGTTGVHWDKRKQKWCARIMAGGKPIFLGLYTTKEEAIDVRLAAKAKYHEFQPTIRS